MSPAGKANGFWSLAVTQIPAGGHDVEHRCRCGDGAMYWFWCLSTIVGLLYHSSERGEMFQSRGFLHLAFYLVVAI